MSDFTAEELSEIIALAWCDKTSFDLIELQFGIPEKEVKVLMKRSLKPSSYRLWRRRVYQRIAKHGVKLDTRVQQRRSAEKAFERHLRYIPDEEE